METSLALVAGALPPVERNPALVYLATLSGSGRESMERKLNKVARILQCPDLHAVPWAKVRFEHVAALRDHLLSREKLAPAHVNCILAAVKGVCRACFAMNDLTADELQHIREVRPVKHQRLPTGRVVGDREIDAMLRKCATSGKSGVRDAALIGVLYTTGIRREEAAGAELGDYDPRPGSLLIRGKGGKERLVYVHGAVARYMEEWLALRGDEAGALFPPIDRHGHIATSHMTGQAVYSVCVRRGSESGLRRFSPHDLRRTNITALLDAGADVITVQQMAGHARPETTARYDKRGEAAKRKAARLVGTKHYHQRGGEVEETPEEELPQAVEEVEGSDA